MTLSTECAGILPAICFGIASAAASPVLTDVFTSGQDGYHTYRIPALVVATNGTIARILRRPQV